MPKGHPIIYTCKICNEQISGTGKFIKHLKAHSITPETYRYRYLEGNSGIPVCRYCGNEVKEKSVPFRDSLEFCNSCRSIVRSEESGRIMTELWRKGIFKDKWKELSDGSRNVDFMFAKLKSRVDVSKPCIFYFVKNHEVIKVGFTFDFKNRYTNLPKTIVRKIEFKNSYNCIKAETEFHEIFKDYCIRSGDRLSEYYPTELETNLLEKFDELCDKLNL